MEEKQKVKKTTNMKAQRERSIQWRAQGLERGDRPRHPKQGNPKGEITKIEML